MTRRSGLGFIEYLIVEAVDELHELVNVIFFSGDEPKLEDPPRTLSQKSGLRIEMVGVVDSNFIANSLGAKPKGMTWAIDFATRRRGRAPASSQLPNSVMTHVLGP
jgi:hypothetical protein